MLQNLKEYLYTRDRDGALDAQFQSAAPYGKVKLGSTALFWKNAMKWYVIDLGRVRRAWRQVEFVYGKLCCGGRSYDIQRLVLELDGGKNLEIHIGDDCKTQAAALLDAMQRACPEIQYGKDA